MTQPPLLAAIAAVLREEKAYATRLRQRGELGRAKLAQAAILEIEAGLNAAAACDVGTDAERLASILRDRRSEYVGLWDDEDGIGTSTFTRVFDLIAAAS